MGRTSKLTLCAGLTVALAMSFALAASAQATDDAKPAPNVPAPGEPRAQEALPEAPPEKMLPKAPAPDEKVEAPAEPPPAPGERITIPPADPPSK